MYEAPLTRCSCHRSVTVDLLVATTNPGKFREYTELLADLPARLRSLADLEPASAEPPEDADSFAENAIVKARAYSRATDMPTVADDSGLEVTALGGAPGVRTKRFFGDGVVDEERNRRLLERLRTAPDRSARFVCVIALAWPDGRVETFEGVCPGRIAGAPAGANGFGYDPVFIADGYDRTMAELPSEVKNRISHRARAAAKLRARLASIL
ncbi:MAG: non-canonical purine NTP pyrophosphatase, RdgB/HAM1 family [Chloroflexi bacterium 13_1_40CM_4_68_4]|nr:MAG: non-canonical purine NTP pyrophosphatase, RdgB/HAM1 family [Chloroflexi bacterium 13_1_40CM_4_68_4]